MSTGTKFHLHELTEFQGDVLCCCMYNCVEYAAVTYAMLSIGGIITTTNPTYTTGSPTACELKKYSSRFPIRFELVTYHWLFIMHPYGNAQFTADSSIGGSRGAPGSRPPLRVQILSF